MKKRRSRGGPLLELFEDRLPPGASLGGLLGIALSWAAIAAIDESTAEAALTSAYEAEGVPEVGEGATLVASSTGAAVASAGLDDMGFFMAVVALDQAQEQDEVPPPPLDQAEDGAACAPQPPAPEVAVAAAAPSGGTDLWDAALSGDDDDSSAADDSDIPVPQANSAPPVSGGALNSSGGGGGTAAPADTGPVVVASAATEAESTVDASAPPATNNTPAIVLNGNDPNLNNPGDFGGPIAPTKGKGVSAAAVSSLLQQSTGTKTNFVTGIHDPGTLGPDATSVVDYNLGNSALHFAGFPGGTRADAPIEEQGEITYPTNLSGGPYPVIVILHGRHSTLYNPTTNASSLAWPPVAPNVSIPSFQGYEYMTPILASYGFIVDSISANGINAVDNNSSDDGGLARAKLVEAHLDLLNTFNTATSTTPTASLPFANMFAGSMNLQDVGLMGHSRGGEGVAETYDYNLSLGSPYGIKAVFALAPIDFQRLTDLNVPFAVMLPYTDGDVSDLQGMHFFDDQSLLSAGDTAPEYEFLVMGADHDLFNTVWTYGLFPTAGDGDDWAGEGLAASGALAAPSATRGADPYAGVVANPSGVAPFPGALPGVAFPYVSDPERLQPPAQQDADTAYESAFFQMYLEGQTQYQPILDGDAPTPASAAVQPAGMQGAIVYATYDPPVNSAVRMDVNQTANLGNLTVNTLGGTVSESGLLTYTMAGGGASVGETALVLPNESGSKQPDSVASSLSSKGGLSQLVLDWNSTSAYWENDLPTVDQNVSGYGTFQFRAGINPSDYLNNSLSDNFSVALTDAEGHVVEVPVSNYTNWLFYPPGKVSPLPKLIEQGIRIPLSAFIGIDLTQVTSVKFNFDKTPTGGLVMTALAFADASPTGKIQSTAATS